MDPWNKRVRLYNLAPRLVQNQIMTLEMEWHHGGWSAWNNGCDGPLVETCAAQEAWEAWRKVQAS